MSSQSPSPDEKKLTVLLWFLTLLGIPTAVTTAFSQYLLENPWRIVILVSLWIMLFTTISIIGKVWQFQENRLVDAINSWFNRFPFGYHKRYLQHLVYRHHTLDMKGLSTQAIYALELSQVFVELLVAPQPIHAVSTNPLKSTTFQQPLQNSIWYYLNNKKLQHMAIIGPPGSGKTTLLKHIALILATRKYRQANVKISNKLPILLLLRDYATAICDNCDVSLSQIVEMDLTRHNMKPPSDWCIHQLQGGKCIVMLDGLDEASDIDKAAIIVQWIERQMIAYPKNRFLVTSRPHGYRLNPIAGSTVLEVQPFDNKQITLFINNWYLANEIAINPDEIKMVSIVARERSNDLLRHLRTNPSLAELAVNPLLLTMIATVHSYRSNLPTRRVELFAEVCDVFLGKRQKAKGVQEELTSEQKQSILQPLAFYLIQNKKREFNLKEATQVLKSQLPLLSSHNEKASVFDILKIIEANSGLIIEREIDKYGFAHLSFQAYLAAVHILRNQREAILLDNLQDSWWHETIRLYSAQVDATKIIAACLAVEPLNVESLVLAVECMEESKDIDQELQKKVETLLTIQAEDPDLERHRLAAEALLTIRMRRMVRVSENIYADSKYITQSEYQLFVNEKILVGEHVQPDQWVNQLLLKNHGTVPIAGVRSRDAKKFCDWLNSRISVANWIVRLPKELELNDYELQDVGKDDTKGYWVLSGNSFKFETNAQLPILPGLKIKKWFYIDRARILSRVLTQAIAHIRKHVSDTEQIGYIIWRDFGSDHFYELIETLTSDIENICKTDISLVNILGLIQGIEQTIISDIDNACNIAINIERQLNSMILGDTTLVNEFTLKFSLDLTSTLIVLNNIKRSFERHLTTWTNCDIDRIIEFTEAIEQILGGYSEVVTVSKKSTVDDLVHQFKNRLVRFRDTIINIAPNSSQKLGRMIGEITLQGDEHKLANMLVYIIKQALERDIHKSVERECFREYSRFLIFLNMACGVDLKLSTLDVPVDISRDEFLYVYISLAVLEERISGNLTSFEGIRLVRERWG